MMKRKRTDDQSGSLFFRLPAEIRVGVYEYLIGVEPIHIVLSTEKAKAKGKEKQKLCSFRCKNPSTCHTTPYGIGHCFISKPQCYQPQYHTPGIGIIPVLQTCRRMYVSLPNLIHTITPPTTYHQANQPCPQLHRTHIPPLLHPHL
ncbi:hypothetical protein P154DRAFT_519134, partial [Amniculicola lignicola CBS 123094]